MNKNSICRKLDSYKKDLSDDSSDINSINRDVDKLIEIFEKAVKSNNMRGISEVITNLREVSQMSDSNISNATYYIEDEICAVKGEIKEDEEAKKLAEYVTEANKKAKSAGGAF